MASAQSYPRWLMISGYVVKKPNSTRRTFSITPYSHKNGTRTYHKPLDYKPLNTLNEQLKKGLLSVEEAWIQIKSVILPRLKKETLNKAIGEARISEQNQKVFRDFWTSVYEGKKILRPDIAKNDFIAAFEGLGSVSIVSATIKDIQAQIDKAFPENNRHNRYAAKINQVLRYLGRDQIHVARRDRPNVRYITWDELQELLIFIDEPEIKDLAVTLFSTGCRLGEAFVLTPRDLRPNGTIYIREQLTFDGKIRHVKNRKAHYTILLKEGKEAFLRWAAIEDKARFRHIGQKRIIYAARDAFPDKQRQISPHDLRHSYVIHMLGLGVPLDKVARLIGDSLKTTEEHYAGFVMSDNEIDFVLDIMNKNR